MRTLRIISRLITGIVFIFSGFVKAVDPLGSTYKFTDYFNAFHIGFLEPLALPLAILLSSTEMVLGIILLLGYRMRVAAWILLVFLSFFTLLTLVLALTNPVTDCGCFGDALILTNWQTFLKNIILMVFVLVIFTGRSRYPALRSPFTEWIVVILFFAGTVLFSIYNLRHLPVLDFRPYAVGTNIEEGMKIPEGAPLDEYTTELIYRNRKTGKEQSFKMDNFPRDTLSWEFIDANSKLVKKGYEPPIHGFNITGADGTDITDYILSRHGYTFMMVSYDAGKADLKAFKEANDLFHLSRTLPGLDFYAVTASNEDVLQKVKENTGVDYDFCLADEITLKTVIRSNPGLLLIKDGTIVAKWGSRDFPGREELSAYDSVFENYPLCEGCDPELISEFPYGSVPGKLESILKYRNVITDSVGIFTIDNFPRDNDEWVFEDSETRSVPGSYVSPFSDLKITSVHGMDYTASALNKPGVSFLVYIHRPFDINPLYLQKLNELAGLAGDHLDVPFEFYGLLALPEDEILRFTDEFISPVEFYNIPGKALNIKTFNDILIVMLNNGKIEKVWKDQVPDAAVLDTLHRAELRPAEQVLLPYILDNFNLRMEKRLVYAMIFAFFTIIFLLRTILGNTNGRKRNV